MTRVAVISDTHLPRGARRLPESCLAELRFGALLPEELVVEVGGVEIGMRHVAVSERSLLQRFQGCAAIVFGHSHLPVVERRGAVWLLNPGSPTERRRAPFHSMIVVRIGGGELFPELLRLT